MSTASDRKAKIQAAAPQRRSPLPWIAGVLVLLLVAGGIVFALVQNKSRNDDTATSLANVTAPPNGNSDKSGIVVNPGKAAASAPTVVLFQDYQCPACKQLESFGGSVLEKYASDGKIKLEYHTMTFLDDKFSTTASHHAAEAAACADLVGAYAKYHDTLYANQPEESLEIQGKGFTEDQLRTTFPKEAGITGSKLTTFQACYDQGKMKNWVVGTNDAASKASVNSTPTLRVNGKTVDLSQVNDAVTFEAALSAAITAASK